MLIIWIGGLSGCATSITQLGPTIYRLPILDVQLRNENKQTIEPKVVHLANGNRIAAFPYEYRLWVSGKKTDKKAVGCMRLFEIDSNDYILRHYFSKGCAQYERDGFIGYYKAGEWHDVPGYPLKDKLVREFDRSQFFYREFDY